MVISIGCPVCGNEKFKDTTLVKDHSISKELFEIQTCVHCDFRITTNAPDQSSISKYYKSDVYISHADGNKGLIEKLYQQIRKITLVGKRNLINRVSGTKQGCLLDYGCGTGAFLHEMMQDGWQVDGIEPDEGARGKAEKAIGKSIGLPDDLYGMSSSRYDVITMWHVLEHVHELNSTLSELKRLLKPNAHLIVAVPNYRSYDANFYGSDWAAYDVPRHLYHFDTISLEKLMNKHGFQVEEIKPMWFDSFYVSMLSEKYRKGKVNYLYAFIVGVISNINALWNNKKCSSLIYIIKNS